MTESTPMTTPEQDLLFAFDGHDVEGVRAALAAGADAASPVRSKRPVEWLLEEYTRSDRLTECLRLLFGRGATLDDPALAPVLLDDADATKAMIASQPALLHHRVTLVSAFTSLDGATLLHVAAEYGALKAARALIEAGADVNAPAALDEFGLNGHTPIFHTVNSNANRSEPIMRLLLEADADPQFRVAGLTWGKGYEWETIFFDVTPASFAQMGLLPQVHRKEEHVYENIKLLLQAAGRAVPTLANVPNRYLKQKR